MYGTPTTLLDALRLVGRPISLEKQSILADRWEALDPRWRILTQGFGRQATGCGATIDMHPRCDFDGEGCYLGSDANRVPRRSVDEIFRQLEALRAFLGPKGNVQLTDGEITLLPVADLIAVLKRARGVLRGRRDGSASAGIVSPYAEDEIEIAMKITFIRAALAAAVFAVAASPAGADLAAATATYGKLLARYVTPRGVKYDAWRASGADLKSLSEVVMMYRSTDPKPLEPGERKALFINLYNAKILETVLLGNPKGSIKELSTGLNPFEIFSRAGLNFDRKMISLNDLEKRLREEFKDPRIHFAVNCASKSCPPISPEPYVAATLDGQLDDAARKYLASPGAVATRTDGGKTKIVAVKIFDWYADDFKASGGPFAFIQKYGPPSAVEAIAGGKAKLDFADYDWSLNAAR